MKLLLYAAVFCAAVIGVNAKADEDFKINVIDFSDYEFAKLAVDANNRPIFVGSQLPWGSLMLLAESDNYRPRPIPNSQAAQWPSLAVTSNDEIAIGLVNGNSPGIYYASKGVWYDWTFSAVSENFSPTAMALDSRDIPHFVHASQIAMMHSWFDVQTNGWVREPLNGFGQLNVNFTPSIKISSDDRILISCWIHDTEQIRAALGTNETGFDYLPAINGRNPSISFDANGFPAAAFERNSILYYAVYMNEIAGWIETPVGTCSNSNMSRQIISLAHNSTGMPSVAYADGQKLMYATNNAGTWATALIDANGYNPDLVFDHMDRAVIAYGSRSGYTTTNVLKLAGMGLESFYIADLNHDREINFEDFAIFAADWKQINNSEESRPASDFNANDIVNYTDLGIFTSQWLAGDYTTEAFATRAEQL